jgi:hypothetical protein
MIRGILLVGGLAIILGVLLFMHRRNVASTRSAAERTTDTEPAPDYHADVARTSLDRLRLASLEAKVSALEGRASQKAPDEAPPRPAREDRATRIAKDFRDHEETLSEILARPRKEPWSSETEKALDARFMNGKDMMKAQYQGSRCTTQACAATVTWPSWDAAEQELRIVVGLAGITGCSTAIALPPPASTATSVEGTVAIRCTD